MLYGTHKKTTLLNQAIIRKKLNIVDYLLSKNANPKIKDEYGYDACKRAAVHQFQKTESFQPFCP